MATEQQVHDYYTDVKNPLFRYAEDCVAVTLLRMGWALENNRDANKHIDFIGTKAGRRVTFDAKYDRYIDTTDRIPFEETLDFDDGHHRQSWGWDIDLDVLAVTGASLSKLWLVRLQPVREHVLDNRAHFDGGTPQRWRPMFPFTGLRRLPDGRTRPGCTANGWAIPIAELPDDAIAAIVPLVHVE